MWLKSHRQVKRDVFLDSDNLLDLSLLFNIVRDQTDTLVVLYTQEILFRPWYVGTVRWRSQTQDEPQIGVILDVDAIRILNAPGICPVCGSPAVHVKLHCGSQTLNNKSRALRTLNLRVASRNKMIAFETSFLAEKMPHLVVPARFFCTCWENTHNFVDN